jgi:hypothetical protein
VARQLGTPEQAIDLLRSHRAELGFVAGAVATPEIQTEPLFEYEVVIGKSALVPQHCIVPPRYCVLWGFCTSNVASRLLSQCRNSARFRHKNRRLGAKRMKKFAMPSSGRILFRDNSEYLA